jgi:hypothetical protein
MRGMDLNTRKGTALGSAIGVGALLFTFACGGTRDLSSISAPQLTTNQTGAPVLVSCEPHQRTLVRQAVVNGAAVSQVECVSAGLTVPATAQPAAAVPAGYAANTVYTAPRPAQPVYSDLGDAQVVPATTYPAARPTAGPVRTRQVVYDERPVQKTRSVKKSAIIIGSSAGVGAGVGAAVGGKKGALIGAAIGGGGATIWDQITRRK